MTSASNFIDMQVYNFLGFLESRPDGERWELVGGMPIMMTPPKIAHQRIGSNLERALNTAIEATGLERHADREIGLKIEGAPRYRPEPEIAAIDADYEHERYASRFCGIVEVLSATDLARNPRTDVSRSTTSSRSTVRIARRSLSSSRLKTRCRSRSIVAA